MTRFGEAVMRTWSGLGARFLPFADAATPDLPLSRLLRLSLFQVSVGMVVVLLIGTLNRVMIVELDVPASLVGGMIALPLLFAPFRALIGFRSDNHRSELGWRRVPFMYRGAMLMFGGLAIMPFALLVLAGAGHAAAAPAGLGLLAAAIAFLLVGAGMHIIQTAGLALATDLAARESRPKVVGLMYVMLLLGMAASALLFGVALAEFSHARLIQVIQFTAVATLVLNAVALWKQEPRRRAATRHAEARPEFRQAWRDFVAIPGATPRLVAIGLGTLGFGMADVLLEPYGGHVLQLSVSATTLLTATLAVGGLFGFGWASRVLSRGAHPLRVAGWGAFLGLPAFALVIVSAPLGATVPFTAGTLLIGVGAGLFGHGTLTDMMNLAPRDQAGLALGAWGSVQATAAGVGIALGGAMRDVLAALLGVSASPIAYIAVYATEIVLLVATLATLATLGILLPRTAGGLSADLVLGRQGTETP